MNVLYPTLGAASGVALSSGGIHSAHADFVNGWRQRALTALVERCVRTDQLC